MSLDDNSKETLFLENNLLAAVEGNIIFELDKLYATTSENREKSKLMLKRGIKDTSFLNLMYNESFDLFSLLQSLKNKVDTSVEPHKKCDSYALKFTTTYVNEQFGIFLEHADEVKLIDYLMQSDMGLRGSLLDIWKQMQKIDGIIKDECTNPCLDIVNFPANATEFQIKGYYHVAEDTCPEDYQDRNEYYTGKGSCCSFLEE